VLGFAATPMPTRVAAPTRAPTTEPTPVPVVAVPTVAPSPTVVAMPPGVTANELGTVMILQYHLIVEAEEDQWTITPDHFRKDLEQLYEAGYRPVSMAEYLHGKIDLPAGRSPVVLTFDDSSPGQFRYLERDGDLVVDPDSALGILEHFHSIHPDWALKGTFFVLPEAEQPHKLFGQPEYEGRKLRYLVERGFDLGNHSWWHQRLDILDDEEVQMQLANAVRDIEKAVPGYRVRTMALPLGTWPRNRSLAYAGSHEGIEYRHEAVFLAGSDPAPSPFSKEFDPGALERVQSYGDSVERWLAYMEKNPDERYVSDGDPALLSFPSKLRPALDPLAVTALGLNAE
jgi:peptidoglycan/xylan/chitin deacetylase (PgdA/CDA1 family)